MEDWHYGTQAAALADGETAKVVLQYDNHVAVTGNSQRFQDQIQDGRIALATPHSDIPYGSSTDSVPITQVALARRHCSMLI